MFSTELRSLHLANPLAVSHQETEKSSSIEESQTKAKQSHNWNDNAKKYGAYALPLLFGLGAYALKSIYDRIIQCQNAVFATQFPSLERNREKEFAYTTRNLNVDLELQDKNVSELEIQELSAALLEGNWKAEVFKDEQRFPYIALQAFKNNSIGKEEFTNVMFYWSIRQHHSIDEIQVMTLYDSCQCLNSYTAEALFKTMDLVPFSETHFGKAIPKSMLPKEEKTSFLDENQKQQFLNRLKLLPRSAQIFFVIPDIQADYMGKIENMAQDIAQGKITISQEIQKSPRINIFNRIEMNGKIMRMVPSFEMMQEMVHIMSPNHSVTIMPTVGLSALEDIRQNGLTSQRDMGLPFPGVELPKTADTLRCTEAYDFFYHDFYHAIQASFVPHTERVKFIQFSDIAQQLAQNTTQYSILPSLAQELKERFLDMEYPVYNPATAQQLIDQLAQHPLLEGKDIHSYRFLFSIDQVMMAAMSRLQIYQAQKENNPRDLSQLMTNLQNDLSCSQFPYKLAKNIIQLSSKDVEGQNGFCAKLIHWGKMSEQALEKMASYVGESIDELSHINWAVQGKTICQNPWLLTSA